MNHTTQLKRRIFLLVALFLPWMLVPTATAQTEASADPIHLPVVFNFRPTNPVHTGVATYYYADGSGACGYGPSPADLMVAAMNQPEWNGSQAGGTYILVNGPKGSVTVRIVDLCPGCDAGHLDLSEQAFASIANLPQGRVNITWQVISPELPGPIAYYFNASSNPWWMAVQIRNHRNPVVKLEYSTGGQWVELPRTNWNTFTRSGGQDSGPFTFRVTDVYGNTLVDNNIPLSAGSAVNGSAQFPYGP